MFHVYPITNFHFKLSQKSYISGRMTKTSCASPNQKMGKSMKRSADMIEDEMDTLENEKIDGVNKEKVLNPGEQLCILATVSQWIFVGFAIIGALIAVGIAIFIGF